MKTNTLISRITLSLVLLTLAGCPGIAPGSKRYAPATGSYEESLWNKSRRDIFPDDIRKQPNNYPSQVLLWTGVVQAGRRDESAIVTDYEHHYWDWILDYGTQRQVAFLSPRGEGKFRCRQSLEHFGENANPMPPPTGAMAIVYGIVERVESTGVVSLNCAPLIKALPPDKYATDIWDYGRNYLLRGDRTDFKVLRVPIFR